MRKVLLVAPLGGVAGGISRWTSHIIDYYRQLKPKDVHLDLVSTGRSVFINVHTSTIKRIVAALKDYPKVFAKYNKELRKNHYDVVHIISSGSWSLFRSIYMLRKARNTGAKCITHFRFGRIPELKELNNWEWKMVQKVVKASNTVIVLDKQSKETLNEAGYDNIVIIPNPVAPKVEEIISANSSLMRNAREILFTGHVVKTKGIFELIDACKTIEDIQLKIVGRITPDVKQEINNKYGSPDWLNICGEEPYEEVIKDMLKCDIFVLPTYTEGFPNVILEAMATGCAIVTTPVGAIPQMLETDVNGTHGILVNPKDAEVLSDGITSLLVNEPLKAELRENVVVRVHERYNIDSVWRQLCQLWSR